MNAPNPGKGWRLLEVGEAIDAKDEWFDPCDDTWNETVCAGGVVNLGDYTYRSRRARIPAKPTRKPHNRLALRMYRAKNHKEAKAIYEKATRGKR